jgi:hypothetical protein
MDGQILFLLVTSSMRALLDGYLIFAGFVYIAEVPLET